MPEKQIVLVVRLKDQDHPGGQRITAHRKFVKDFTLVVVNEEQAKEIKADEYLVVEKRATEQWFKVFGLEFTEENVKKYKTINPPFTVKTSFAEIIPPAAEPGEDGKEVDKLPKLEDVEEVEEPKITTREDLIKAVEARGLVSGKDFAPDASDDSLKALLL